MLTALAFLPADCAHVYVFWSSLTWLRICTNHLYSAVHRMLFAQSSAASLPCSTGASRPTLSLALTSPQRVMPLTDSTEMTCFCGPRKWKCWLCGFYTKVWRNCYPDDASQSAPSQNRRGTNPRSQTEVLAAGDMLMVSETSERTAAATDAEDVQGTGRALSRAAAR